MPKLVYEIDCQGTALEIAAHALTMARAQGYAQKNGLVTEERTELNRRQLLVAIPLDELNSVLDELLFAGLLFPLQEIRGRPDASVILHERFSTLTWVDES